ncbi:MAG TPA: tetratricopeptide repeat protein [Ktedonobacteraceae bacterium]|nr:tetratricopeptide repeat protein [Ktedonobacteraceae bacterium]
MADIQPITNQQHIFISYAHNDGQKFAHYLYNTLHLAKIPVWLDVHDVNAGKQFYSEIRDALQNALAVVVVLTPGAVSSIQVEAEWNYALSHYLPVIPMYVSECDIPHILQVLDYIDCRTSKKGIADLKRRLRTLQHDHLLYLQKKLAEYTTAESNSPGLFNNNIEVVKTAIEKWKTFFRSEDEQIEEQRKRVHEGLEAAKRTVIKNAFERSNPRARRKTVGVHLSDVANFKNRIYEQQRLSELLARPTTRIVSLVSRGGMGKTAIASKVLANLEVNRWSHIEQGDIQLPVDGIIYLGTRNGGISLERIFTSFAELIDGRQGSAIQALWTNQKLDTSRKVMYLLEILKDGLYILLLDNMEDILDDDGAILDSDLQIFFDLILLTSQGVRLLVTSRIPIVFKKEMIHHNQAVAILEGLPDKEAIELLCSFDPTGESGLRDAPHEKLLRIVQLVKGVPRALEVVASILANDPFTTLDELLMENSIFVHDRFVEELVKENYERLDNGSQLVLEALAVYTYPVLVAAIDYLLEPFVQGLQVPLILRRLIQTHVVSVDRSSKTVVLHPIDHDYIHSRLPKTGDYNHRSLEKRAASYYTHLRLPKEQWVSLSDIEAQLREFEHLVHAEEYEAAAQLINTIDLQISPASSYLFQWGHVKRARDMRERLMHKIQTPELQWINWYQLGLAYTRLGETEKAIYAHNHAVDIARRLRDTSKEGISLIYLGLVYFHKEMYDQAIEYFQQALPMNHNKPIEGNNLGHLGNAYASIGQIDVALDYLQRASNLCRDIGDQRSEAFWLGRLGDAYHQSGHLEEAMASLQQALTLTQIIGDKQIKVYHLSSLGDIYVSLKQFDEAINLYREAISLAHEIGDQLNKAMISWNLGLLYADKDLAQAIALMSARVEYEKELQWADAEVHAGEVRAIQARMIAQAQQ